MEIEKLLNNIKTEFMKELDKRKDLLDKIARLQNENEQLKQDLKAYRAIYKMKNEVCEKCVFADECLDANRVDGQRLCTSFHAKLKEE